MNTAARLLLTAGAVNGALAVALGAFGAHALRARLDPDMLAVYHTAVQYHFYHALGLLLIGILALQLPSAAVKWPGILMCAGIVMFCGSLYLMALTNLRWLGAITPLGGAAFITAWLLLAATVFRKG